MTGIEALDAFGVIGNSTETIRCTTVLILLTDGHFDNEQSEEATSKIISLVEEQLGGLMASSSKKSLLFVYSMDDDADTRLTKRIACGTGGIWKHIGNNDLVDLVSSLISYHKLFAIGISDGEQGDCIAWVEPYLLKLLGR